MQQTTKVALVTGASRGMGLETCRQDETAQLGRDWHGRMTIGIVR
jgi:NAD(P)-dependent dehydrogenase (short-subunit alcohol dehydrogenase family)